METAKNLTVICQWQDSAYNCTVDIWDDWNQVWETNVPYTAREGDPAPVNQWILEQIATGAYNPISACPIPPPPPQPTVTASYSPSPATAGQPTTLSWTTTNATYVTFQSRGLTQYPASGSLSITYPGAGIYDDVITAVSDGGSVSQPLSVTVI
jgi:hypothetical protein